MHVPEVTVRKIEQLAGVFDDRGGLLRLPAITEDRATYQTESICQSLPEPKE